MCQRRNRARQALTGRFRSLPDCPVRVFACRPDVGCADSLETQAAKDVKQLQDGLPGRCHFEETVRWFNSLADLERALGMFAK